MGGGGNAPTQNNLAGEGGAKPKVSGGGSIMAGLDELEDLG